MSNTANNLTNAQQTEILVLCKGWRNAVRRGDVTAAYAATEVASEFTRPYADVAHYETVRAYAQKFVR